MNIRFLHCADIHLGYLQYNEKERFNDFGRALMAVVDKAVGKQTGFDPQITGKVDFVILAGDHIYKMDYDKLVQYHKDNRADLTVAAPQSPSMNSLM